MNEFEIIKTFFRHQPVHRKDVILGSGDDCALVKIPPDQQLAISIDTFISGVHFPEDSLAYDIAYKALAVNLSDLAAMGAEPAWFTCALTIPNVDENWLKNFAAGLFDLANLYQLKLIGGDLTRGHLSITIGIHGFVPNGLALRRDGAKIGDAIYLSKKPGAAAYALKLLKQQKNIPAEFLDKFNRPKPEIELGLALRGKAHSAIDISDGLVGDLNHILESSNVGASIYLDKLILMPELEKEIDLILTGGDDYGLCFTGPENLIIPDHQIYCIGQIEAKPGLRIYQPNGELYKSLSAGYQHF